MHLVLNVFQFNDDDLFEVHRIKIGKHHDGKGQPFFTKCDTF